MLNIEPTAKLSVDVRLFAVFGDGLLLSNSVPIFLPGGLLPVGSDPGQFALKKSESLLIGTYEPKLYKICSMYKDGEHSLAIVYKIDLNTRPEIIGDDFGIRPVDILRADDMSWLVAELLEKHKGPSTPVQPHGHPNIPKDLKLKEVIIHTDGGSRGNPGPSAAAYVIMDLEMRPVFEEGAYLGITTNNQAEYQAVKMALERSRELGVRRVKFLMDSLLVVNQMQGIYKVKNRDLWPIYVSIKELIGSFDNVTFQHVLRKFNSAADTLVNKTLDERPR